LVFFIRIDKLEEILEPPPENVLVKKYQLKELELCYINADPTLVQDKMIDKRREVLDRFVPHKRLVHLKIENYYGKEYPSWILELSNLQRLHLQNCVWCEELPSLGELPQLKFLAVTGFVRLCSLGMEFRGDLQAKKVAFRRLQQLFIGDMKALHTWSDIQSQDLPQLHILRLSRCIKLTTIPLILQNSTTLTRLEVDTTTKISIEDKLRGFTKGKVINITNTWEPQQDEIVEALVVPPNEHPSQQDEIVEAAEPQNAQPPQQDKIIEAATSQNPNPSPQDIVEAEVSPQNTQTPKQDKIVEFVVAPQNGRPGRFKLDWKKAMLFIIAFFALLLPVFITKTL
jgi:Leucine-rich repeat (LRR) protein